MKGMIIVKPERCVGCRSCQVACAVEHSESKDLYRAILESPAPAARIDVRIGEELAVPLQCRQCEKANCIEACPKDALSRSDPDSPVVLDTEKCIGCSFCVIACPFGLASVDEETKKLVKCDQCFERLQRDELPACVIACPTGALVFERIDEIPDEKREGYLVLIGSE